MNALDCLLETYRTAAISERDKGTAFEKLVAAWLVTDPVQNQRFERRDFLQPTPRSTIISTRNVIFTTARASNSTAPLPCPSGVNL